MTDGACHICAGPLELLHAGDSAALTPDLLVPTNHEPGQHGDLYRCAHCGTVHQPGLPEGEQLADLYRGMSDDAYLSEEEGRRATAAAAAGPDRPPCPGRRAPRCGLRPRAAPRRGSRPRVFGHRSRAVRLRARLCPRRARARRARRDDGALCRERIRRTIPADRARRRDRAPGGPACCARCLRGPARARGRPLRDHARPVVGCRSPRRPALVGLHPCAHIPVPATDAARAARVAWPRGV